MKQSYWSEDGFHCTHAKEIKRQDTIDYSTASDYLLFKAFLNYMIEKRVLKVDVGKVIGIEEQDISTVFKENKSKIITIANVLCSLQIIKYINIENNRNEEAYVFPDVDDSLLIPNITEKTTFDEEDVKAMENEVSKIRKRIEKLENLTSSQDK